MKNKKTEEYSSAVKVRGFVECVQYDTDGSILKKMDFSENIVTNAGLAAIAGLVGNTGAITAFSYIALGTDSTAAAASQTTLVAETAVSGLTRTAATVSRVTTTQTNDTLQFVYAFTAAGSADIKEVGIFNASSSGTMLARKVVTTFSLASGQGFTVTYKIVFS